jgi:hypothetical protein
MGRLRPRLRHSRVRPRLDTPDFFRGCCCRGRLCMRRAPAAAPPCAARTLHAPAAERPLLARFVARSWISQTVTGDGLAAVRTFRILRPLRSISRVRGMRLLVQSLLQSLPALRDILCLFGCAPRPPHYHRCRRCTTTAADAVARLRTAPAASPPLRARRTTTVADAARARRTATASADYAARPPPHEHRRRTRPPPGAACPCSASHAHAHHANPNPGAARPWGASHAHAHHAPSATHRRRPALSLPAASFSSPSP